MKMILKSAAALILLLAAASAFAVELIAVDDALKKTYKSATGFGASVLEITAEQVAAIESKAGIIFKNTHSTRLTEYKVSQGEAVLGYAYEDTVMGKWGPIHYLLALDPQGMIIDVVILGYQEVRGKPIAKKRFLRQYKSRTVADPLTLRRDIDGVTGATISSRSLTDGVRKLVFLFHEMRGE